MNVGFISELGLGTPTYARADSMICDFIDRRPMPVSDYVVSIVDGPLLVNLVPKIVLFTSDT